MEKYDIDRPYFANPAISSITYKRSIGNVYISRSEPKNISTNSRRFIYKTTIYSAPSVFSEFLRNKKSFTECFIQPEMVSFLRHSHVRSPLSNFVFSAIGPGIGDEASTKRRIIKQVERVIRPAKIFGSVVLFILIDMIYDPKDVWTRVFYECRRD